MKYDGSNPLQAMQARSKLEKLIGDGKVFDLTEKKPVRTLRQNAYLHVCLGYFASQTGNTLEYVKQKYFKILCNRDLFVREVDDKYLGRIKVLRSSSELDTSELTTAIERFRNWSASEAGIYIPSPEETRLVQLMEIEIERNKYHMT